MQSDIAAGRSLVANNQVQLRALVRSWTQSIAAVWRRCKLNMCGCDIEADNVSWCVVQARVCPAKVLKLQVCTQS